MVCTKTEQKKSSQEEGSKNTHKSANIVCNRILKSEISLHSYIPTRRTTRVRFNEWKWEKPGIPFLCHHGEISTDTVCSSRVGKRDRKRERKETAFFGASKLLIGMKRRWEGVTKLRRRNRWSNNQDGKHHERERERLTIDMKTNALLEIRGRDVRILGPAWQMFPIITHVGDEGDGRDAGVGITGMTFQHFLQHNHVCIRFRCWWWWFEPWNLRPWSTSYGLTLEFNSFTSNHGGSWRDQFDLKWLQIQINERWCRNLLSQIRVGCFTDQLVHQVGAIQFTQM